MAASTSSQLSRTVAVANQKGGVGKSTSTICLARAAHIAGHRTLVVDLDAQANTTSDLAAEPVPADTVTIADALVGDVELADVVVPAIWERVMLAPAGATLSVALDQLASVVAREMRLRKLIKSVTTEYDLILIDCPPALGLSTVNALTAANDVILVAEPDAWSLDAVADFAQTVADIREDLNPNLGTAGVLLNRYRRTAEATQVIDELVAGLDAHLPGTPVWTDRTVPLWTDISKHVHAGRGLDEGPPRLRQLMERVYSPIVAELVGGSR
ncbi:chromosome partitioning protein [Prauserella rugosa]|uniref:Chromosome partitioning protein n=2 Tax=Prauserella rugosa TaxID=43354 RepID=A0A660C3L3_9PSEU|nr:AAA family ATPase [Prauserella rugosa]TWH15954.1 chromosome partitioning protein [Prauserella rugosa]